MYILASIFFLEKYDKYVFKAYNSCFTVAYREFLVNIYNIFVKDMSCKRNAFMMLIHADQERALSFLSGCMDQVSLEQHTYRPDQGPSSFIKVILIIINH